MARPFLEDFHAISIRIHLPVGGRICDLTAWAAFVLSEALHG
jgi:hypothetical protein